MPLPQQVINQLTREGPPKTPGWSSGILLFSGGIFAIALIVYFGMTLAYGPYLNSQVDNVQGQVMQLGQSISSGDQIKLLTFYSQISNLRSILARHVLFSQFFAWLEKNTSANVYYSQFSFSSGSQISLIGIARTEADVNQQIAVFEASPQIKKVSVSNVTMSPGSNMLQFTASLVMDPSVIISAAGTTQAAAGAAASATSSTTK